MEPIILTISADARSATPTHAAPLLEAGGWEAALLADPAGANTAWNAWSGQVSGCGQPGKCAQGWLNWHMIWSIALEASGPPEALRVGDGDQRYASPAEALAAARPVRFRLTRAAAVFFFFDDGLLKDNVGGLTIRLCRTD